MDGPLETGIRNPSSPNAFSDVRTMWFISVRRENDFLKRPNAIG